MNVQFKEFVRDWVVRHNSIYSQQQKRINAEVKEHQVLKQIAKYVKNVPYYRSRHNEYIKQSVQDLPVLRKPEILGHSSEFVSDKVLKSFLQKKETGGSTGFSLELFYSPSTIIKKQVYTDYVFSLIGSGLKVAMLRGVKPQNGAMYEKVNDKLILMSSYQLIPENLETYLKILRDEKISCIHAYPSSITILARMIEERYHSISLPYLKGILCSSEIFSKEAKQLVRSVFCDTKIVDFYSHNELACCAWAVNDGPFHFDDSFGYVEFIPTGEITNDGSSIAEIVATSMLNEEMPFVRYGTEDYVELDEKGNVISIIGRSCDFIVNKDKTLVPCIVVLRNEAKRNVTNFQYYQDSVGILDFRIVTTPGFNAKEEAILQEDLVAAFNGKMDCRVVKVDCIERTKAGKQMRLIQKLNLSEFK